MSDFIDRQKAIEAIRKSTEKYNYFMGMEEYTDEDAIEAIKAIPSAEPERKWIPFTTRELTEEEREENPEWDWVFTCKLPADGETVLLTNGKYVWEDMFCCDDGCYFDKADDIEDYDGYAWMPLPEPPKIGDGK